MKGRLRGGRPLPRWGRAAVVLAALLPATLPAQTPAGTRVESTASVSYETPGGLRLEGVSNRVVLVVGQVAGVDLEPARHAVVRPGDAAVLAHVLRNAGNGPDVFLLTATSARGWPPRLFVDTDGDGVPAPSEARPWGAAVEVGFGDSARVLVVVPVPAGRAARGEADTVRVTAVSRFSADAADAVVDLVEAQDAGTFVALGTTVDRATVTPGARLTYRVRYAVTGSAPAAAFVLSDTIPSRVQYVPGTLRWDGTPVTDAADDDAAEHDDVARVIRLRLDSIAPGATGELSFQVRATAPGLLENRSHAEYETRLGAERTESDIARTDVVLADLGLEKAVVGDGLVGNGDTVRYVLTYENRSAVPAHDVVLVDTLPEGLEFVAASPAPVVTGRELRWSPGTVASSSSSRIELATRVVHTSFDPKELVNVAVLRSTSALSQAAAVASAVAVRVDNSTQAALGISKTADVLEVGLGDVAPYSITVENTGPLPLTGVRIHDRLPAGTRLVPGSVTGPFVVTEDESLTFRLTETLEPGARATVRYTVAVVSAGADRLRNVAHATAEGGRVRSAEAVALLRVRSANAMATRTAIGKVFVDEDGDGIQGPGEPGVAGVDIWSDGGEVVTTDGEGRFSVRNVDAGRRSFRLDPATLPLAYGAAASDLEVRDVSGWSTPRVNFALAPRAARLERVFLPLEVTFQARPIRGAERDRALGRPADADSICAADAGVRIRLQNVEFELDRATLRPEARAVLDRVADVFLSMPELRAEVAGHTDATGEAAYNQGLSERRAAAVAAYLAGRGVAAERLSSRGYGEDRPVTTNATVEGRASNRRVELVVDEASRRAAEAARALARASLCADPLLGEYRVEVRNPYQRPVTGLVLVTDRSFDSIHARVGETRVPLAPLTGGTQFALPGVPAGRDLVVLGWFGEHPDSATVALHLDGTPRQTAALTLRAEFHNPLMPVSAMPLFAAMDSLPPAGLLPPGATLLAVLAGRGAAGDTGVYRVPQGWAVADSVGIRMVRDRDGAAAVAFGLSADGRGGVQLRAQGGAEAAEPVGIPSLRSTEEREAERRRALLSGPGVELFHPIDGSVHAADRLFIGVRGEPGAPVALFDGDSVLRESVLRPDGVADFVAVPLTAGTHRLRVRMQNSWGSERWDSVAVHVSGAPAAFAFEQERARLVADGHTLATVRARVVDAWGVPVVSGPLVTVDAGGGAPVATDADPASVGVQVKADADGWVALRVRPGHEPGPGEVRLSIRDVRGRLPLEILPATRPLMVTAVGRAGVGASPENFGTVTVRGRIDEETSVLLRYDSRSQADALDGFDRAADPLDAGQYAVFGDASERRTEGTTRGSFSATVRRGLDWVTIGDLSTTGFTDDLALTSYQRSLTGAAARVRMGATTWEAFASSTGQAVVNERIRGQGISGPYTLGGALIPGTERVTLETRAVENADRVLGSQTLIRWVDYQVDYETGVLLFRRPVPAVDGNGNPVFIAVTFESFDSGESRPVWGIRSEVSAGALLGRQLDALDLGATLVREENAGAFQLAGGDATFRGGAGSTVRVEVSHAQSADSSGVAALVEGSVRPTERLELEAAWRYVGAGYHNPSTGQGRGGSSELRVGAAYEIHGTVLSVTRERQAFEAFDVVRERFRIGIDHPVSSSVRFTGALLDDRFGGPAASGAPAGEAKLAWTATDDLTMWIEGRRRVDGLAPASQPDFVGAGAELAVSEDVNLTLRHRQVGNTDLGGSGGYGVSDLGLRSRFGGGELWSSYQLAGAEGARDGVVLGYSSQLALGRGWTLGGSLERRVGLADADPIDPVRALPFLQNEEDYWAGSASLALAPGQAPYRLGGRAEIREGDVRSTRMLELSGELSLNGGLALLGRQQLLQVEMPGAAGTDASQRAWSLVGVAFRPTGDDRLNVLGKLELLDAENPVGGGVLTSRGDERRLIGTAEAIWAPLADTELGLRVASRHAEASHMDEDGTARRLTASAAFIGWRAAAPLGGRFGARLDGRTLVERNTGTATHDVAPQLTFAPVPALEIAAGYRFGDLQDPDFAVSGGAGAFLTAGARLTERSFRTAADYWRERLGR